MPVTQERIRAPQETGCAVNHPLGSMKKAEMRVLEIEADRKGIPFYIARGVLSNGSFVTTREDFPLEGLVLPEVGDIVAITWRSQEINPSRSDRDGVRYVTMHHTDYPRARILFRSSLEGRGTNGYDAVFDRI